MKLEIIFLFKVMKLSYELAKYGIIYIDISIVMNYFSRK